MKYYKILIGDNEIIIDKQYSDANNIITVGEYMYFVLCEGGQTKDTWIEITEEEWNEIQPMSTDAVQEIISDNELIQAEMLLNQQMILINQQNQDETLAAILLVQAGQMIESY